MKYGHIGLFVSEDIKYWRLPVFVFIVSFLIALYAGNQAGSRYCDEGLVILGTSVNSGVEVVVENPYVTETSLNMSIAGMDGSIQGRVQANPEAFELQKRRIVRLSLEGDDPRKVRAALKYALEKFNFVHEEKYAEALELYRFMKDKQDKRRALIEKIISTLSSDKSIPPSEYAAYKVELEKMAPIPLPTRTRTQIPESTETRTQIPESTEARLCKSRTKMEVIFSSAGWGFIGSIMAIFGAISFVRTNRR